MRTKKNLLLLLCFFYATFSLNAQQSSLISNYSYSGIYLNPAFTAMDNVWKLTNTYSNKSLGFSEGSKMFFLSANGPINLTQNNASFSTGNATNNVSKQNFTQGIGAYLVYEEFGAVTNFSPTITYSQHFKLNRKYYLGFGLGVGLYAIRYDLNKLNLKNKEDEVFNDLINKGSACSFLNVNAGMVVYSDKVRFAYSAMNMTKGLARFGDNENFPSPVLNHTLNLAFKSQLNTNFYLISSLESMFTKGIKSDNRISASVLFKNTISAGLSYRPTRSIGFTVEARYSCFCIHYMFDVNTSQFEQFGNTAHQIGLKLFMRNVSQMEKFSW